MLSQVGEGLGLGGHDRDQDLARDLVGAVLGLVAVDLLEQVAHQLGDVLALLLDDPAALAADPAAADEEHLDGRLELVVGEGEDVGVGLVGEDDRVLLERLVEGAEVVAEPGGQLVLLRVGRRAHLPLDALGELGRCCRP